MPLRRAVRILRNAAASPHPVRYVADGVAERFSYWKGKWQHRRVVSEMVAREGLVADGDLVRCPPGWIIGAQPGPRLDLYVRILAVEEFAGLNTVGARLYDKFMNVPISAHRSSRTFDEVFQSVVRDGFSEDQWLVLHRNRVLGDGWHRLSCAIFLGIPQLALRVVLRPRDPFIYTTDTLRERGFTAEEIDLVSETEQRVLARLRSSCRATATTQVKYPTPAVSRVDRAGTS
jgi:hypothetical protein